MQPHILVVDDEESIRFTFDAFLTEEGYAVSTAADYDEGIALLKEKISIWFSPTLFCRQNRYRPVKATRRSTQCAGDHDHRSAQCRHRHRIPANRGLRLHHQTDPPGDPLEGGQHRPETQSGERRNEQCRLNFEAIFRSVNDGIITVDEDMQVVEINDAADLICGFKRDG